MSKFGKLSSGIYIILKDYSEQRFPPRFDDEAQTHESEANFMFNIPGGEREEMLAIEVRKPFWSHAVASRYLGDFLKLLQILESLGLAPGMKLLELGCGSGWMSEMLAQCGYNVMATTISPFEIELAERRRAACQAKHIRTRLQFAIAPMESVDQAAAVQAFGDFDAVFVYEALHHAFDWRKTFRAAYRCLKPGGWFFIANEPNVLHTFISYRVARLVNTHEIGLSQSEMLKELRQCGFAETRVLAPRFNNLVSHHWVLARK